MDASAIPLETRTAQIDTPQQVQAKTLGLREAQQQLVSGQQEQQLRAQTMQDNALKLAADQRAADGDAQQTRLLKENTIIDPETGQSTTDHEVVAQGLDALGFSDRAEHMRATGIANQKNVNEMQLAHLGLIRTVQKQQGDMLDYVLNVPPEQRQAAWQTQRATLSAIYQHNPQAMQAIPVDYPGDAQAQALADQGRTQEERLGNAERKAQTAHLEAETGKIKAETAPGWQTPMHGVIDDDTVPDHAAMRARAHARLNAAANRTEGNRVIEDYSRELANFEEAKVRAGYVDDRATRTRLDRMDATQDRQREHDYNQDVSNGWRKQTADFKAWKEKADVAPDQKALDALGPPPSSTVPTREQWEAANPPKARGGAHAAPDYGYGTRYNNGQPGGAPKGLGFLGPLQRPDGGVMSEYSIGVTIDGKEVEIPSIVPTLSKQQITQILSSKDGDALPSGVAEKATAYAKQRIAAGKDPFAGPGEQQNLYPDLPRQAKSPNGTSVGFGAGKTFQSGGKTYSIGQIQQKKDGTKVRITGYDPKTDKATVVPVP
jgi:hypothetical protein